MKNGLIIAVLAILFIGGCSTCNTYNKMIDMRNQANEKWANVQSQYQRRFDLFDNVVNTIKGAADFEKSTLKEVIKARSRAVNINLKPEDLTPENLVKFQEAQAALNQGIGRLMLVAEQYPDLKTNIQFRELQAQVEGTENRIGVARDEFSKSANLYNTHIQKFPATLFAGMFNFKEIPMFKADEEASKNKKIDFKN